MATKPQGFRWACQCLVSAINNALFACLANVYSMLQAEFSYQSVWMFVCVHIISMPSLLSWCQSPSPHITPHCVPSLSLCADGFYRGEKLINLKQIADEALVRCKDRWVPLITG